MPLVDETTPRDVIDSILKLAGMLQGAGISLTIGKPGKGDSDEDIVVRIKADAPVLRPDEPVPTNPVFLSLPAQGIESAQKSVGAQVAETPGVGVHGAASLGRGISTCVDQMTAESVATAR